MFELTRARSNRREHDSIQRTQFTKAIHAKKTIKRGFNVWILADQSGYAWTFDIYTGKSSEGVQKNFGSAVVKSLYKVKSLYYVLSQ